MWQNSMQSPLNPNPLQTFFSGYVLLSWVSVTRFHNPPHMNERGQQIVTRAQECDPIPTPHF